MFNDKRQLNFLFNLTRTLEVVPDNTMPAFKKEQKRWDKQANHN